MATQRIRSPQLQSLGDYLKFASVYAIVVLILLAACLAAVADADQLPWITALCATVPFAFLPEWWATHQRQQNSTFAPASAAGTDSIHSTLERICYLLVTIAVVTVLLGGGMLAILLAPEWLQTL
ncbi:MAG: hypothetical protein AB8H80_00250 [Planctomycetota bacterium]